MSKIRFVNSEESPVKPSPGYINVFVKGNTLYVQNSEGEEKVLFDNLNVIQFKSSSEEPTAPTSGVKLFYKDGSLQLKTSDKTIPLFKHKIDTIANEEGSITVDVLKNLISKTTYGEGLDVSFTNITVGNTIKLLVDGGKIDSWGDGITANKLSPSCEEETTGDVTIVYEVMFISAAELIYKCYSY